MISAQQTVADVVLQHSVCAQVLQRHRIDFCCRGDVTLEAAAQARGLSAAVLVDELSKAVEARAGERATDFRELSTANVLEHLVRRHHAYQREALPLVRTLAAKVSRVHGEHNPRLRELATAVEELAERLIPRLDTEQALFPTLAAPRSPTNPTATDEALTAMQREHQPLTGLLSRVRAAAEDFTVPEWGCRSYRALFAELEQLESNVLTHVAIETHVLQPRFAHS